MRKRESQSSFRHIMTFRTGDASGILYNHIYIYILYRYQTRYTTIYTIYRLPHAVYTILYYTTVCYGIPGTSQRKKKKLRHGKKRKKKKENFPLPLPLLQSAKSGKKKLQKKTRRFRLKKQIRNVDTTD